MREPSLRQLEALFAVVETGSVSKAAEVLRISQPAASKLLQDLEADTELQLFQRQGRRLLATQLGLKLYEEVERVFGGVNQLAKIVDALRREERGHLRLGCLPALSGRFVSRVLSLFRSEHPDVFISLEARSSRFLVDAVISKRLDLAIVTTGFEHPSAHTEVLRSPPGVAIVPPGHRLSGCKNLAIRDLKDEPFIAFAPDSSLRRKVDALFEADGASANVVIEATTAPNVGELVAAGLGVSIADPLSVEFLRERVAMVPFEPTVEFEYEIIRSVRARKCQLVDKLVQVIREAARVSEATE